MIDRDSSVIPVSPVITFTQLDQNMYGLQQSLPAVFNANYYPIQNHVIS